MKMELRINVNANLCMGCRICELICSLVKYSEFNPSKSAIRIIRKVRTGTYCPVISPFTGIVLDAQGNPLVCDFCSGNPRCVQFCPTKAIVTISEKMTEARRSRI
jgi:Fe-S-cluster-containing dehydrogenase component